jgi:bifunctional DNase/RNase
MAVIDVTVAGLALDEQNKAPVVVLKDASGEKVLPIVIGIMEASAIAAQLEGVQFPRPMTHDLMGRIIEELGGKLVEVEVCDLVDDTFMALLHIEVGEKRVSIDARPSDSIALALRCKAKITVNERVFEKAVPGAEAPKEDDKMWQDVLENMNEDDFGKYKM